MSQVLGRCIPPGCNFLEEKVNVLCFLPLCQQFFGDPLLLRLEWRYLCSGAPAHVAGLQRQPDYLGIATGKRKCHPTD